MNEQKPSNIALLNKMQITKVIRNEFRDKKLNDSFKDIQMFNDIKTHAQNSKINLEICLYGLHVSTMVLKLFLNTKNNIDIELIKNEYQKGSIKTLFITTSEDSIKNIGINALEIAYIALSDSFKWSDNFENFINSKELKITKWNNPIEQLITCIAISKTLNCYFDLDHHIKSAASILFLQDDVLKKFSIERPIQKKEQLNYLLDNLNTKVGKKFFGELSDSRLYRFKSNAGYPYFKAFARWLPKEYEAYLTKSLDIYSSQTKKDFITKYKIANHPSKLLMLIFNRKDIPKNIRSCFANFLKSFNRNGISIESELSNIPYNKFELAVSNFSKICKIQLKPERSKLLYKKGLFRELISYAENNPGPIIQKALDFVPQKNQIIKETIEYNGYEVSQVLSGAELTSIGSEFHNCLRDSWRTNYQNSLKVQGFCFLVFRRKSKKSGLDSFIAYLDLREKKCHILEMLRKNNANCSRGDRKNLYEFLMDQKLIDIPEEYFGQFFMKKLSDIASKNFDDGINHLIDDAPILLGLIKSLPKPWFRYREGQLCTDEIEEVVSKYLEQKHGLKKLSAQ